MQIPIRVRDSVTGGITLDLPAIDVQGVPLLVLVLIVYNITGTTPALTGQLFTSDDLETWQSVGSAVSLSADGTDREAFLLSSVIYGRYVRVQLALTGGATPTASYSLYLNTYASS